MWHITYGKFKAPVFNYKCLSQNNITFFDISYAKSTEQ